MINLIKNLGIREMIAAGSGLAVILNVVLSKLNLTPKIEKFFNRLGSKLSGCKEIAFQTGYNAGIIITTKAKTIPLIGTLWESGIEPLLVITLQLSKNLVVATAGLIITFLEGTSEGVKSDNNQFKLPRSQRPGKFDPNK